MSGCGLTAAVVQSYPSLLESVHDRYVIERPSTMRLSGVNVVERDDTNEHQQTTDRRVDKEFYRRVNPSIAAPDANQKEHRHQ